MLGLADSPAGDQQEVYREFRDQLSRNAEEGQYETGLPWKGEHPPLPSNHKGSLQCLCTQVAKLQQIEKLREYNEIIQNQLKEGVVDPVPSEPMGREYSMPHRVVIKESTETTKFRVQYSCSACGGK